MHPEVIQAKPSHGMEILRWAAFIPTAVIAAEIYRLLALFITGVAHRIGFLPAVDAWLNVIWINCVYGAVLMAVGISVAPRHRTIAALILFGLCVLVLAWAIVEKQSIKELAEAGIALVGSGFSYAVIKEDPSFSR